MRRRHGFTLVEIMVVLAILAVVAAVTVPAFRDNLRPDALQEGTDAVVHVLERARLTARTGGHRVTVTIDPSSARYWVDRPTLDGTFALQHDVTIRGDRPRIRVAFEPTGSASADKLAVSGQGGSRPIRVDRLTGEISTNADTTAR